jgi:hypothetical protein
MRLTAKALLFFRLSPVLNESFREKHIVYGNVCVCVKVCESMNENTFSQYFVVYPTVD